MNNMQEVRLFFFIGTDAELIKIFPVILEVENRRVPYAIIASGQNNITNSRIFSQVLTVKSLCLLSDENDIKKSAFGLVQWWKSTYRHAAKRIRSTFPGTDFSKTVFIVHGDTISTVMGSYIGKKLGARIAHVEAGMRSHHLLNPFPEEIDRILTSRKADIHFAANRLYCENLNNKATVINTYHNTIYDSLQFSKSIEAVNPLIQKLQEIPYFVFVIHRQENLANTTFLVAVTRKAIEISKHMHCAMIMHKPTEIALKSTQLLYELKEYSSVTLLPRMDYFDFMKLLDSSEFVITDGGSNQQELHYMGKPCIIIRKRTESLEGLGTNACLYGNDLQAIPRFFRLYQNMKIPPTIVQDQTPSQLITTELMKILAYGD